ncbi:Uncharacterised protein [Serratia liquefaciens]|uniref:hypothetical protein n=1 Tax=Serratia liquefaciens TaxID=614 RepID=UPI0021841F43|nr:hypothetical protein [Serratia liquefaciens]CAI2426119.1 Uncharacterised protein [Serratia liquefaciens]
MTNYEILQYLIADGGFYIRDEHITLLRKAFPDENITPSRISALRCSITQSKYVTAEIVYIRSNIRTLKVLAVDPQYQTYARARPKESFQKITDSYLRSEPPEVVRHILLVQQFNKLLAPVTHQRAY